MTPLPPVIRQHCDSPHSTSTSTDWIDMHTEVPAIPPVIDVDAELEHWRRQHADGALPHNSFGSYVPWIKFACDSLITQPVSYTHLTLPTNREV